MGQSTRGGGSAAPHLDFDTRSIGDGQFFLSAWHGMPSFGFDTTRLSLWKWCRLRGAGQLQQGADLRPRTVGHCGRCDGRHAGAAGGVSRAVSGEGLSERRADRRDVARARSRDEISVARLRLSSVANESNRFMERLQSRRNAWPNVRARF